jgi:hypothetical protein
MGRMSGLISLRPTSNEMSLGISSLSWSSEVRLTSTPVPEGGLAHGLTLRLHALRPYVTAQGAKPCSDGRVTAHLVAARGFAIKAPPTHRQGTHASISLRFRHTRAGAQTDQRSHAQRKEVDFH